MNKPSGWDSVPANTGGFERPVAGPCVMKIVTAEEKKSQAGDDMLVLGFDIAEGSLAGYYAELGERFVKNALLMNRNTTTEKGMPYLKGTIKSIEESNPGFVYDWNPASLVGKLIGANLREEEYLSKSGDVKSSLKIGHVCPVDDIRSGKVKPMNPKLLDQSNRPAPEQPHSDDDLPF